MDVKAGAEQPKYEFVKWLVVFVLVAAGVVFNYMYVGSLLYRVLALVALAVVAGIVALKTQKGVEFSRLLKEARVEIRRVVWPTRQELGQTTMIVILFVLFVALVLWGLDSLISFAVSTIIA